MSLSSFSSNTVYPSYQLPATLMLLEDWSLVLVEGKDSKKYLQDQLTVDVYSLKQTHYVLSAHCNFNGKVWSVMYLFHYNNYYAYIERSSVVENQIKQLRKYSIFSRVIIKKNNDVCLLGLAGYDARLILLTIFEKIPDQTTPIIQNKKAIILWFQNPSERFLLILSIQNVCWLKERMGKKIFLNDSKQWLSLDIESQIPIIDDASSAKFIPQSINLEFLQAINFQKGCYYGQEIIARIHFRNLNKRFLCILKGKKHIIPSIGSLIEMKIEKTWYKIGVLLSFVHLKKSTIWIQVVLDKPVHNNNIFRINQFEKIFFKKY
ncbi:tRNA-modifying protein YgfZ [Buchnera aphidicola]|uniref:tRNA-modifying protein YgfZ n=1 Tax=Buchnera aphidicola TaxID=9 RepID=UPI003464A179